MLKKNSNHIKSDLGSRIYTVIIYVIVTIVTLVITYPLYFCVIASFSDPNAVVLGDTILWFKGFTTEAYRQILKYESLMTGYRNSFIYMVLGTAYDLALTIPAAYVCSKKKLPGHKIILWYFFLTMYVSGGLIPTYLWYKKLGLVNNPLVMIIGPGVTAYYMVVARQFFMTSIPESLYEAAEIDGAGEFKQFFKIAIPLSKPIIAVIMLYYAFGKWNNYYTALIYLRDQKTWPLQLVLRQILLLSATVFDDLNGLSNEELDFMIKKMYMIRAMKYAVIIVASLPMLILYPFVSKYFTQGIMIGSVKE